MLRQLHTLRFAVRFACSDVSFKLTRNTEKTQIPFSLSDRFVLSSSVNMSDEMYVAPAVVCKRKIGRRQLTRSKWTKNWLLKRNFLSHANLLSVLKLDARDRFTYLRSDDATYPELLQKFIPQLLEKQSPHTKD